MAKRSGSTRTTGASGASASRTSGTPSVSQRTVEVRSDLKDGIRSLADARRDVEYIETHTVRDGGRKERDKYHDTYNKLSDKITQATRLLRELNRNRQANLRQIYSLSRQIVKARQELQKRALITV